MQVGWYGGSEGKIQGRHRAAMVCSSRAQTTSQQVSAVPSKC